MARHGKWCMRVEEKPAMSPDVPDEGFFYIEADRLVARFPEVHPDAETDLVLQRTLRVPDDGKPYPLPAGLGQLPLRHLEDFEASLPRRWRDRGGIVTPMWPGEAMWLAFDVRYPCAIKIGTGKINVLNGRRWSERLSASEQDYLVAPPQPALDGYRTREADVVRQFVAVPLGRGYSAEEQITGKAAHGGIQIVLHPMQSARYELLRAEHAAAGGSGDKGPGWAKDVMSFGVTEPMPVGIAAGGRLSERIIADPFGVDCWDQAARIRCFLSLIDAREWPSITDTPAPTAPFTAADYEREGLPWFAYYKDGLPAAAGASDVLQVKSIGELQAAGGLPGIGAGDTIEPREVRKLRPVRPPRRSRHPSPVVRAYWTVHRLFRP
jgi:hypothetical protein